MSYHPFGRLFSKHVTAELYPLFGIVGLGCVAAVVYPGYILTKHNDIIINKSKPLQFESDDGQLLLGEKTVKKYLIDVPMGKEHSYHKL